MFGSKSKRKPYLIFCLFISFTSFSYLFSQSSEYARITVQNQIHQNYGLAYPMTYQFRCESILSSATVFLKYYEGAVWTPIPIKTRRNFSGVTAVRFDTINKMIYVSVPFLDESDQIFLQFNDSTGIEYQGITRFYDNRKMAVTATADDWDYDKNIQFGIVCSLFTQYQMWLTVGVITNSLYNQDVQLAVQEKLNSGYIEVASHSRTHNNQEFVKDEVLTSKSDIFNKLDLPPLFKNGDNEYLYTWIMPGTVHNLRILDMIDADLGSNTFLVDRRSPLVPNFVFPPPTFVNWNVIFHLYTEVYFNEGACLDYGNLDTWKAVFNESYDSAAVSEGEIFHLMLHPFYLNSNEILTTTSLEAFLNHIKERDRINRYIWYVSLGHLYLYHFLQENEGVYLSVSCGMAPPNEPEEER